MSFAFGKRNVFQIIISDVSDPEGAPHNKTKNNRDAVRKIYEGFDYHLFNKTEIESILVSHFSSDILDAFNKLTPYSYKVDLCKYCLMLQFGGVYIDISMLPIKSIVLPEEKSIYCFRDAFFSSMSPWAMSAGLMMSIPGRKEFKNAVDLVVENCRTENYGANPLDPTGPGLLGRAFALANSTRDLVVGDFRCLTGLIYPESFGYIDGNGGLVAIRNKTVGADLSHLGVLGTNNYNDLYSSRVVYGEDIVCELGDPRMYSVHGLVSDAGIKIEPWMLGILVFGPYVALPSGSYVLQYKFSEGLKFNQFNLEISSGASVIAEKTISDIDSDGNAEMIFYLAGSTRSIEARLNSPGEVEGYCLGFTIRHIRSLSNPDLD